MVNNTIQTHIYAQAIKVIKDDIVIAILYLPRRGYS